MDPIVSVMVQPFRQAELGVSGQTSSYTVTRTLPRTHCIYVPARVLTGDEITDNSDLVHARLDGTLAPAPERMFDDVTSPRAPGQLIGLHVRDNAE